MRLQLALNVASTRVVLLDGHTGSDAAGRVIEAFGHFVVGGNYVVGGQGEAQEVLDRMAEQHQQLLEEGGYVK